MFARAVKQDTKAPLQPNPTSVNAPPKSSACALGLLGKNTQASTVSTTLSSSTPSAPTGIKRKLDALQARSNSGLSALVDVQFDEDDFSDDDLLISELQSATPIRPKKSEEPLYPTLPIYGSQKEAKIVRPTPTEHRPLPTFDQVAPQHVGPELVSYPKLPSTFETSKRVKTSGSADTSTSKRAAVIDLTNEPTSSAPVEWSSSPPHHMLPSLKRPQIPSSPAGLAEAPKKRGKLPWAGQEANATPAQSRYDGARQMSTSAAGAARVNFGDFKHTPKTKDLWNTTASAMKEEQKKHREQARLRKSGTGPTADKTSTSTSASKQSRAVQLSEEQKDVVKFVVEMGKSVFFTGSAGTGKSVLMGEIIRQLRMKYRREPDRIAVTASTGLAACNIEGTTLHSCAGIGLGNEPAVDLVKKVMSTPV